MMDLNSTLFGQMLTFAVFILFTMNYVWPPLMRALEERRQKIADGLAAAEKGRHDYEAAQEKVKISLQEAKTQAQQIITSAEQRAGMVVNDAKDKAQEEGARLLQAAKAEIEREYLEARKSLFDQVAQMAAQMAEATLRERVNNKDSGRLIDQVISEV